MKKKSRSAFELRNLVRPALASLDQGEGVAAEQVFKRLEAKYAAMAGAEMGPSKSRTVSELRRLVEEGIASGASLDAEPVFVRLRAKYGSVSKRKRGTKRRGSSTAKR